MKSYYQKKGAFTLPKSIYQSTRKYIACYDTYIDLLDNINAKSPVKITEDDSNNRIVLENNIKIIEDSLNEYVRAEYRKAVFEHCAKKVPYRELEMKYYIAIGTMKEWTQRYAYGVAKNRGEVFD